MFSTVIVNTGSGAETRIGQWSRPRSRWDFSYKDRPAEQLQAIDNFFRNRYGRLYGFRWKDWADYTAVEQELINPYPLAGPIQLQKTYSDAAGESVRIIFKPIASTVVIRKNGSVLTLTTDYTIDATTGIVTLTTPPAEGDDLDWSGEFDVPVRFEEDALKYTQIAPTMYSMDNCAVVEILVIC